MQLIVVLTLISCGCVVYSDISMEVNQKCPCIERDVCLVKSNYQVFSAFQESAPECPEEKVRCCSETMMLLTLLKIQNLGGLRSRIGRHQKFNNVVDLECRIPSECTQIYGSQQFHFIHISPQKGCPEPYKIRCVVPKERHENGLQCILAPLCLEIFGTKQEHFQVYGYQTACRIGHVRCVKVKHSDSGGVAISPPTLTPAPGPAPQPVTPAPGPMTTPDLMSITVTQTPDQTTQPPLSSGGGGGTTPDLESVVITSRPPVQGPVFGTPGSTRPPGGIPDLESIVITSRPRLEVRPFRLEGPGGGRIIVGASEGSRAPSVQIIGPSHITGGGPSGSVKIAGSRPFQKADLQAATRLSEADIDRAELEALLRLARERVRELYGG